jgi:hypothetical protein
MPHFQPSYDRHRNPLPSVEPLSIKRDLPTSIALTWAILALPFSVEAATLLGIDLSRISTANDPGVVQKTGGGNPLEPGFQGFYLGNAFGTDGALATLS